jgi:hypothetical protein
MSDSELKKKHNELKRKPLERSLPFGGEKALFAYQIFVKVNHKMR